MPTYQYRCTDCGEPLEVVQSFTDDALTVCPACGGALRKVFSSVGVVFKGSGFYRTDSRAESTSAAAKAETRTNGDKSGGDKSGGDKSGGDKSGGDKTDTKSDTKNDTKNETAAPAKSDTPAGSTPKSEPSTSKSSAA